MLSDQLGFKSALFVITVCINVILSKYSVLGVFVQSCELLVFLDLFLLLNGHLGAFYWIETGLTKSS